MPPLSPCIGIHLSNKWIEIKESELLEIEDTLSRDSLVVIFYQIGVWDEF